MLCPSFIRDGAWRVWGEGEKEERGRGEGEHDLDVALFHSTQGLGVQVDALSRLRPTLATYRRARPFRTKLFQPVLAKGC